MSRRFHILFGWWLAVSFAASGTSVEIPVIPASLDTYSYVFTVSTNATRGGTAFRVTMTAKTTDIDTNDSSAGLDIVTHTGDGGGLLISCRSLEPAIPVTLSMGKRRWMADFIVSSDFLKNPDLYFDFGFLAHSIVNGKSIPMPSVTRYEIRLEDFTGQISDALGGRWQTAWGDTYAFTEHGEYDHWLQTPAISKSGQADASGASNRTGISRGKFSVCGNCLILMPNDGMNITNWFYVTKGGVNEVTGKFFESGDSFIILSYQKISKYELMYR